MIQYLLLDIDDTILDFHKSEHLAIKNTLREFGIEPTQEVCDLYSRINQEHWERLERKEITRPQVLVGRFAVLMETLNVSGDAAACCRRYMENLTNETHFLPEAREALETLSQHYALYGVSNGNLSVQRGRLAAANISHLFQRIFISEEVGVDKPDPRFFKVVFDAIPGFDPQKAMIVGDSLTSDILGGIRSGIRTCWVNAKHKPHPEDICPDHEIEKLSQLMDLLR